MKRVPAFLLMLVILLAHTVPIYACEEGQSQNRVLEILFGDDASTHEDDEKTKMLMNALYLCCEQSDNQGQDKIDFLKKKKVSKVPTIANINVKNSELIESSHIGWDLEYASNSKARSNRKKVLQNTVDKVFGFGFFQKIFGGGNEKSNSIAALLYYSHILADYLADDPEDTEVMYDGNLIPSYAGSPYVDINGGIPSFTASQKRETETYSVYSGLDSLGRCGVAFAILGDDTMPEPNSRQNIGYIKPSGWNQEKYEGIVNSEPPYIYNRCHLIAHQLDGNDGEDNLITGTRYLNETGMKPFEDLVAEYIRRTGNHVVYRVTPVYEEDNKLASGVQIEAYSIEDKGEAICFNVYCYNIQPGISINYVAGTNESAETLNDSSSAIPFATNNPNDTDPDLIYEISKHLTVLFKKQKNDTPTAYTSMMNEIEVIANDARSIDEDLSAQSFLKKKECEYQLFQCLRTYVPTLLKKEGYFKSAFK